MKVRVLLNQTRYSAFWQYTPAAALTLAWKGELESDAATDPEVLQETFRRFNLTHPTDYHERSLSVGDVVTLNDDRSFSCEMVGWKLLPDVILESRPEWVGLVATRRDTHELAGERVATQLADR
jgi:YodL-like